MSLTYRIQTTRWIATPGTCYVVPDYSHPETPFVEFGYDYVSGEVTSLPAEVPDGRIIVCHPKDEQRLRDALARAQETPQWWLDEQKFQRVLRAALKPQ